MATPEIVKLLQLLEWPVWSLANRQSAELGDFGQTANRGCHLQCQDTRALSKVRPSGLLERKSSVSLARGCKHARVIAGPREIGRTGRANVRDRCDQQLRTVAADAGDAATKSIRLLVRVALDG